VFHGGHLDLVAAENGGTFIPPRTCGGSYSHLSLHSRHHFALL
jgi:hypothetical protein